jgi:hypothetical protein
MIEIAKNNEGMRFCVLEHPIELDKLEIGEFTYFKKYLGMSDYMANFKSWLKRPTVYLIVAIFNNSIVGWSMNEIWSKPSTDGRPVFVLRAIEISPELSRKGLGRTLFILVSRILPGHIITKPVNTDAKKFFGSLDFSQPARNCPVDLADHPGYLVLNENAKFGLSMDSRGMVQDRSIACKIKMFPKEAPVVQKDSRLPVTPNAKRGGEDMDIGLSGTEVNSKSGIGDCSINEFAPATESYPCLKENVIRELIGKQKMLSSCECGNSMAGKFLQGGKRPGTAFICESCGKERYFLPLKKAA